MEQKLFSKDFTLVVIGQITSLFGNAMVRFALPLYLLNQTGSSVLYGTVTACAFIPAILLSPVGGFEFAVIWFAGFVSLLVAIGTKNIFKNFSSAHIVDSVLEKAEVS